jgi:dolichyl-phosphate-mannose--protein O-mannosyl transferase
LWVIKEADGENDKTSDTKICTTGEEIKCGQRIRLEHMETGKNLHSHKINSPISHRNEVSGFGDDGEGNH